MSVLVLAALQVDARAQKRDDELHVPSRPETVVFGAFPGDRAPVLRIQSGQRVVIVDDLLATGGTANACVQLARSLGGNIAGMGFVVELDFLNGRKKFEGTEVFSLLHYDK